MKRAVNCSHTWNYGPIKNRCFRQFLRTVLLATVTSGLCVDIGAALTNRGLGIVRFDFTGLGKSEGTFAKSYFSANVNNLFYVSST
jgi:hypothetical protein